MSDIKPEEKTDQHVLEQIKLIREGLSELLNGFEGVTDPVLCVAEGYLRAADSLLLETRDYLVDYDCFVKTK